MSLQKWTFDNIPKKKDIDPFCKLPNQAYLNPKENDLTFSMARDANSTITIINRNDPKDKTPPPKEVAAEITANPKKVKTREPTDLYMSQSSLLLTIEINV